MSTQPGWYADPSGVSPGSLRYFDGTSWTVDVVSPVLPVRPVTWKGAAYGRPPVGPGSVADPWLRFAAQLLDWLILLPVGIALYATLAAIFVSNASSLTSGAPNTPGRTFSFIFTFEAWFLVLFAGYLATEVCYQAITTAVWGRSPGKAIVHIRPICLDGSALGWGRSFGRAGAYVVATLSSVLFLVDVLWCCWDDNGQCVHDKVCDTLVIHD
jgi:uncharacterized RDD family membrane protein YckC